MEFIVKNWYLIVAAIAVVAFIIFAAVKFFKMPTKTQIDCLKKWLRTAVIQAEITLGSKTGALKLQMVYDMAISKFPWVATVVPFEAFRAFVDEALKWLENQCEANPVINAIVHESNVVDLPNCEEDNNA